jgi:hypothetical protein
LGASLGKKFTRPSSQPMAECGGMCLSLQLHREAQTGLWSRQHKMRPNLKRITQEGLVQVLECLPSKCEALSLTQYCPKSKKKRNLKFS